LRTRSIIAFALVLAAMGTAGVASAFAGSAPGPMADTGAKLEAGSSLSADSWTHGLFGTLKADEDGCAADRRVVVYEQEGEERDPSSDRQVDVTRTATGEETGDWSTRGGNANGSYYADAVATGSCAGVTSAVVKPDLRDGRGAPPGPLEICGSPQKSAPFPEQLPECRIATRVTVASCGGKHLADAPSINCEDPDGIPCLCQSFLELRQPSGDRLKTTAIFRTRTNPFMGFEVESYYEEGAGNPRALFAKDIRPGAYKSVYPPQAEPGQPGGPLLLSEDADGKTIRIEGIVYAR
jgi:hypothetical protein